MFFCEFRNTLGVQLDVSVVAKSDRADSHVSGVLFGDTLLGVAESSNALTATELGEIHFGTGADGDLEARIGGSDVVGGEVDRLLVRRAHDVELAPDLARVTSHLVRDVALLQILGLARAFLRLRHVVDDLVEGRLEGDQADAVGDELVVEHGGVVGEFDGRDGEGGDFGEENAAEAVCKGGVEARHAEGDEAGFLGGGFVLFSGTGIGVNAGFKEFDLHFIL